MRARSKGHIVNVASLGGIMAIPDLTAYGASKAGLAHLTETLRTELRGAPIGITLIQSPRSRATDMYYDGMNRHDRPARPEGGPVRAHHVRAGRGGRAADRPKRPRRAAQAG